MGKSKNQVDKSKPSKIRLITIKKIGLTIIKKSLGFAEGTPQTSKTLKSIDGS
jgi:hypothetical protein